jgi:hypothetical protein
MPISVATKRIEAFSRSIWMNLGISILWQVVIDSESLFQHF